MLDFDRMNQNIREMVPDTIVLSELLCEIYQTAGKEPNSIHYSVSPAARSLYKANNESLTSALTIEK